MYSKTRKKHFSSGTQRFAPCFKSDEFGWLVGKIGDPKELCYTVHPHVKDKIRIGQNTAEWTFDSFAGLLVFSNIDNELKISTWFNRQLMSQYLALVHLIK